jgi:hypothetical protein
VISIPSLLADDERTKAADRLSTAQLRFIVAGLINTDGARFDALLRDMQGRPAHLRSAA